VTSKTLAWVAFALCAVAFVVDVAAIGVATFAMRPESDDASGVLSIGSGLAILANLVALIVAIVSLVLRKREQTSSTVAIVSLVLSIFGVALVPFVWIVWILVMSPIGIH
jgi:ABC-type transport system involved in multi-copper enzyme maturation permease subunit